MSAPQPDEGALRDALAGWGLDLVRVHAELALGGSPQRSLWRGVVEVADGRLLVLERIAAGRASIKRRIAEALEYLDDRGLTQAVAYRRSAQGDFLVPSKSGLWQLAPYVAGVPLDRPAYLGEAWRGGALAGFLIELRAASRGLPMQAWHEPFSLRRFARHLWARLRGHAPALLARLGGVECALGNGVLERVDAMPCSFCHGDLHVINVIWAPRGIAAVIDWEFCGPKPAAYDLAVLLGCVGVEDPAALRGPLALQCLRELRAANYLDESAWQLMPEMVLAARLTWLSEWLRNRDAEMTELELDYLALLADHLEDLRAEWDPEKLR